MDLGLCCDRVSTPLPAAVPCRPADSILPAR